MAMVQIPTLARFGDEQKIDEKNLKLLLCNTGGHLGHTHNRCQCTRNENSMTTCQPLIAHLWM
jgi:hypothetical protein